MVRMRSSIVPGRGTRTKHSNPFTQLLARWIHVPYRIHSRPLSRVCRRRASKPSDWWCQRARTTLSCGCRRARKLSRKALSAPDGGGGDVAIAEEGVAAGLHELWRHAQLLLHLIDHPAPARVDAHVLKRLCEIRHVALHLHAQHLRPQHVLDVKIIPGATFLLEIVKRQRCINACKNSAPRGAMLKPMCGRKKIEGTIQMFLLGPHKKLHCHR